MPHIALPDGLPGITGPLAAYPRTAKHLTGLVQELLRGESTLTPGRHDGMAAFSWSGGKVRLVRNHETSGGEPFGILV